MFIGDPSVSPEIDDNWNNLTNGKSKLFFKTVILVTSELDIANLSIYQNCLIKPYITRKRARSLCLNLAKRFI